MLALRKMIKQIQVVVVLLVVMSMSVFPTSAANTRWQDGLAIQLLNSQINVRLVRSDWANDVDPVSNGQGPIYFNDCLSITNQRLQAVTHIQIVFASVSMVGVAKRPLMPLGIYYKNEPLSYTRSDDSQGSNSRIECSLVV